MCTCMVWGLSDPVCVHMYTYPNAKAEQMVSKSSQLISALNGVQTCISSLLGCLLLLSHQGSSVQVINRQTMKEKLMVVE